MTWLEAFALVKAMPHGTRLGAYKLDFVLDEPHPRSVWLTYRENKKQAAKGLREGDPLLIELVRSVANGGE